MEYRKLGNTGLEVSVLGFGASSLGGVFHQVDPEACVKTVWAALDGGINFFDVSPAYGETLAETNLGNALKGIARAYVEEPSNESQLAEVLDVLKPIHNFNFTRGRLEHRDSLVGSADESNCPAN